MCSGLLFSLILFLYFSFSLPSMLSSLITASANFSMPYSVLPLSYLSHVVFTFNTFAMRTFFSLSSFPAQHDSYCLSPPHAPLPSFPFLSLSFTLAFLPFFVTAFHMPLLHTLLFSFSKYRCQIFFPFPFPPEFLPSP